MRLRPPTDPYLEALVAFGRLARNGCGATMHCHNSLRIDRLVDEAAKVVRAARGCRHPARLFVPAGRHLALGLWRAGGAAAACLRCRMARDWRTCSPLRACRRTAGGGRRGCANPRRPPCQRAIWPDRPAMVLRTMLEAIAEASARSGRRIHMHLLESPRQRVWLDRRFPEGIVERLDRIGFLSPRLAVAHGVQLAAARMRDSRRTGRDVGHQPLGQSAAAFRHRAGWLVPRGRAEIRARPRRHRLRRRSGHLARDAALAPAAWRPRHGAGDAMQARSSTR